MSTVVVLAQAGVGFYLFCLVVIPTARSSERCFLNVYPVRAGARRFSLRASLFFFSFFFRHLSPEEARRTVGAVVGTNEVLHVDLKDAWTRPNAI